MDTERIGVEFCQVLKQRGNPYSELMSLSIVRQNSTFILLVSSLNSQDLASVPLYCCCNRRMVWCVSAGS